MIKYAVRIRLALLFGSSMLFASAILLLALYLAVDTAVRTQPINIPVVGEQGPTTGPTADEQAARSKAQRAAAEAEIRRELHTRTLAPFKQRGPIVLGGLTAVGCLLGWFVAGMTMRPLRRITATTRRIADRNLHERIALTKPRDEWWELAAAIDAMLSRLDAAFAAQRQFVGNASHELKTPLAINRTLLDVAMSRPDAPPELLYLGETLLAVNVRHERLVDGLLALARAEHRIADSRPVNLAEVIDGMLDLVRPEADRLQIKITSDPDRVIVDGDRVLLDRLVQNLLQNAIRHNVPGGWVCVDADTTDGNARLTVANTGPVVAAAAISELFEPFRRAVNRVRSAQGSGLGLSIVWSVARAHGGTVVATPREEGGLEVEVTIPQVRDQR